MIQVVSIEGDEYHCICPFHRDNNPSLSINIKKHVSHCFAGCPEAEGSAVKLVSKLEMLPRSEAWRRYITGQVFDFSAAGSRSYKSASMSNTFADAHWVPADSFDYLLNRGFDRGTIRFWRLEYSPEIKHIRIPVTEKSGDVVCYSYRTVEDLIPKYLHPGLRKKSGILYGEYEFESRGDVALLTEGSLDCIWLWQNGYPNSLAFLGTPVREQIEHIFEFGRRFVLCFDADEAGEEYARKVIAAVTKHGLEYKKAKLPDGKDVQEMPREALKRILEEVI